MLITGHGQVQGEVVLQLDSGDVLDVDLNLNLEKVKLSLTYFKNPQAVVKSSIILNSLIKS